MKGLSKTRSLNKPRKNKASKQFALTNWIIGLDQSDEVEPVSSPEQCSA